MEESTRGDGKGYFRIAVQRRPPAVAKAIKQPWSSCSNPLQMLKHSQDTSRLDPMAITTIWSGLLDAADEGLPSLLVPPHLLLHLCGMHCPPQGVFPSLLWIQ